jgi:hypothetical protein
VNSRRGLLLRGGIIVSYDESTGSFMISAWSAGLEDSLFGRTLLMFRTGASVLWLALSLHTPVLCFT